MPDQEQEKQLPPDDGAVVEESPEAQPDSQGENPEWWRGDGRSGEVH